MLAATFTPQDPVTPQRSLVKKWQGSKWEERAAATLMLKKLGRNEKAQDRETKNWLAAEIIHGETAGTAFLSIISVLSCL